MKANKALICKVTYFLIVLLALFITVYIIIYYKNRPPDCVRIQDQTWQDKNDENQIIYHKWRYFLKPRSYLPFKIEKYSTTDPNTDYTLTETLLIEYPTDKEMRKIINSLMKH